MEEVAPQPSNLALEHACTQKDIASAIWAMSHENPDNQTAVARAGGIPPLIALLSGHPEVHRQVCRGTTIIACVLNIRLFQTVAPTSIPLQVVVSYCHIPPTSCLIGGWGALVTCSR